MELRDLEFITRLAEFRHFGRAAKELCIDVSTLSRHVSAVEDDLGLALFERGREGVRVTAQGQDIIDLAHRALADVQAIHERAAQAGAALVGRLRLATERPSLGPNLRRATAAWRKIHPEVQLDLMEAEAQEIVAAIRDRRMDAAILFNVGGISDLVALNRWEETLVLAVPSAHDLADEKSVNLSQVSALPLLVQERYRPVFTEVCARLVDSSPDVRLQHAGSLDLLNLVAIGEGAMLACAAHGEVGFPGVTYVRLEEPHARIQIALVWHPDLKDSVAGSFVAFMRDWPRT